MIDPMKPFYVYDHEKLVRTIDAETLDDADDAFSSDYDDHAIERDCVSDQLTMLYIADAVFAVSEYQLTTLEHDDIFH